jgi:hypothetical protein
MRTEAPNFSLTRFPHANRVSTWLESTWLESTWLESAPDRTPDAPNLSLLPRPQVDDRLFEKRHHLDEQDGQARQPLELVIDHAAIDLGLLVAQAPPAEGHLLDVVGDVFGGSPDLLRFDLQLVGDLIHRPDKDDHVGAGDCRSADAAVPTASTRSRFNLRWQVGKHLLQCREPGTCGVQQTFQQRKIRMHRGGSTLIPSINSKPHRILTDNVTANTILP